MGVSISESADGCWARKRELASKYDALSSVYEEVYRDEQVEKYRLVFAGLQNRSSVVCVEIGCGTGIGLALGEELFDRIWVGIDLSEGMLKKARRRIIGVKQWHLVLADSDSTPLRSNCADLVICVTLLSKALDPVRTLKELKRLASPGGEIVVTVLKKEFAITELRELTSECGLKIRRAINACEGVKDHVAFCLRI
jgi:ubiquinone/menaquinone biosynthesis C-methylase UbiE